MKHISAVLVVLLAFAQCLAFAQVPFAQIREKWDNPSYSCSESSLELQTVTFFSDQTVLSFKYTNKYDSGGWVNMEKTAALTAYPSGNIYTLKRAIGMPYAPAKHEFKRRGETLLFYLIFPPVPPGTTSLTFDESYSSPFKIYNIKKNSSRNRSTTYTAFAASFSYPDGTKWSDFSDWQECNFTIEFDASSKIFTFNTAKAQKYKVVESDYSDPSLFDYSYSCKDILNNLDCSIHVATLPEDGGIQVFLLRFDDEQICYAIKEDAGATVEQPAAKEIEKDEADYEGIPIPPRIPSEGDRMKDEADNDGTPIPYELVETKPSFMGGDANEFSKWVNSRLNYPEIAKKNGIQGRVTLRFTVETDGRVTNVKVLRGVDPSLDKEAVRVVSSSPKWNPGRHRGRAIRVTYTFPVIFQLRD